MCMSTPSIPAPPKPPAIPQAPQRQDANVLAARKKARDKAGAQSGFSSTILTGGRGVNGAGLGTKNDDEMSILSGAGGGGASSSIGGGSSQTGSTGGAMRRTDPNAPRWVPASGYNADDFDKGR